jgi:hypothetical protein
MRLDGGQDFLYSVKKVVLPLLMNDGSLSKSTSPGAFFRVVDCQVVQSLRSENQLFSTNPWHQDKQTGYCAYSRDKEVIATASSTSLATPFGLRLLFDLGSNDDPSSSRNMGYRNGKTGPLLLQTKKRLVAMNALAAGFAMQGEIHHGRLSSGITVSLDIVRPIPMGFLQAFDKSLQVRSDQFPNYKSTNLIFAVRNDQDATRNHQRTNLPENVRSGNKWDIGVGTGGSAQRPDALDSQAARISGMKAAEAARAHKVKKKPNMNLFKLIMVRF